jgi:hypothetical protein
MTSTQNGQAAQAHCGGRHAGARAENRWTWSPTWSPADITPERREQLNAIGFSFGGPARK